MDLGIKGKNAIICASSRGLGRGCAMALAEASCNVVVNGRDAESLKRTAEEIRERFGVSVMEVRADISTREGQKALLDACPQPDILVNNNAGPPIREFQTLSREEVLEGLVQNMVAPLELIQATIEGMAERGFGRIVNITSLSVYMPMAGLELSSGARAGLTSFLAGVARQFAASNVTINHLLPGKFATDRLRANLRVGAERAGISIEEHQRQQTAEIPAARFGTPEEFGRTCAFLCSAHAGYITGQNIRLDGGLHPSAF